jgi:RNA polymerase sporulation-specific sigma factor
VDLLDDAADDELVAAARSGDARALDVLLLRYRGLVRARAAGYFLVGADGDDVVQEGMIGLYKAVLEFDASVGAGFRSFADLCISRQIITAVKTANRLKHGPLNDYVSFDRPLRVDDDECTLAEVLPSPAHTDPAEQVLFAERVRDLRRHVATVLSDLEAEVLRMHVDGRSYREIAGILRRHAKSVDNALQRIKRKIDSRITEWDAAIA